MKNRIDPVEIHPLPEADFIECFHLCMIAGGLAPETSVTNPGFYTPDFSRFGFYKMVDDPKERIQLAASEFWLKNEESQRSFLIRFFALIEMLGSDEMSEYFIALPGGDGASGLAGFVIGAAATATFNPDGTLNLKSIKEQISRISKKVCH